MNEWLPIETAPKDGTDVLLHIPGRPPIVAGWFHHDWLSFDDPDRRYREPDGWLPIPKLHPVSP